MKAPGALCHKKELLLTDLCPTARQIPCFEKLKSTPAPTPAARTPKAEMPPGKFAAIKKTFYMLGTHFCTVWDGIYITECPRRFRVSSS